MTPRGGGSRLLLPLTNSGNPTMPDKSPTFEKPEDFYNVYD